MGYAIVNKDNTQVFIGSGETLTLDDKIHKITSVGDISAGTVEEIEVTNFESDAKEFAGGLSEPGEFDIEQYFVSEDFDKLLEFKENETPIKWGVHIKDNKGTRLLGVNGAGLVKDVKTTGLQTNTPVKTVITIRRSGKFSVDFELPTA